MLTTITATTTMSQQSAIFGIVGTVTLIVLLIAEELLSSYEFDIAQSSNTPPIKQRRIKKLLRAINITTIPLIITFIMIVVVKVFEVL